MIAKRRMERAREEGQGQEDRWAALALFLLIHQDFLQQRRKGKILDRASKFSPTQPPTPWLSRIDRGSFAAIHTSLPYCLAGACTKRLSCSGVDGREQPNPR